MLLDPESAYRQGFKYLRVLVDSLTNEELEAACPQCPEWSVKGVLVHLMLVMEGPQGIEIPSGFRQRVMDSIINADPEDRRAAGVERDRLWNQAVGDLDELSVAEIWDRWSEGLERERDDKWRGVADFAVHLGDIEEALGTTASFEFSIHAVSLSRYAQLINAQLATLGLETTRFMGEACDVATEDNAAKSAITGRTYELLRIATGRRTLDEAAPAVDWGATRSEVKAALPVYGWLTESRKNVRLRGGS